MYPVVVSAAGKDEKVGMRKGGKTKMTPKKEKNVQSYKKIEKQKRKKERRQGSQELRYKPYRPVQKAVLKSGAYDSQRNG